MAIEKFKNGHADPSTLKEGLAIALDEALTALEESLQGLTDEQASARPFSDRHSVTTFVMHVLHNIDINAVERQTSQKALDHEKRFNTWWLPDPNLPERQENLPAVREMVQRLRTLREAAMKGLAQATDEALLAPPPDPHDEWWTRYHRTRAAAYMRAIWHTMGHVRQIWFLRGVLGLSDKDGWPRQHYS